MEVLGHNFWTWNPSKSFKVSKDLDFNLVPNKNLSKNLFLKSFPGYFVIIEILLHAYF